MRRAIRTAIIASLMIAAAATVQAQNLRFSGFGDFVFGRARCTTCHSGLNFTDGLFHNTGVMGDDLGRAAFDRVGEFQMRPYPFFQMKRAFKTPSLRNVALTAPYQHDGSEATLLEVVTFYNKGGRDPQSYGKALDIRPLNLTDADLQDLVAFLESLTGITDVTIALTSVSDAGTCNRGFLPASVLALRGYTPRLFATDLIAGIYCAIVTGLIISALGGSTVQIGGPTGAFVVVVSGIIATYGVDGLFMCTMMAGVVLVVMGLTGTGTAVRFIPRPVVTGFTGGIAVTIGSTQLQDFFGITLPGAAPGEFIGRIRALVQHADTASLPAMALGGSVVVLILVWNRLVPRVPGYIAALIGGTLAASLLHLPVATIGSRFGGIPAGLPHLQVPAFRPGLILTLMAPTFTVAMLGAIESLMSAVVADRMTGTRHNSNVELFAQGIANIASPLVGGLPATGAIARTATNVRSGARTPVAGIVHALTLLAILLAAAPLAAAVPMAVLAGILLVVAFNMGEWHDVPALWKQRWADPLVWLATFSLTILADLTVAVEVGMILAALLFISRVASTTTVSRVTGDYVERGRPHILQDKSIPDYVTVLRIHGPFLFGATDKLTDLTAEIPEYGEIVALRLRNMTALDATGLRAIQDFADALSASGRTLLLCGALPQPSSLMDRAEFHHHVGAENILPSVDAALVRAREVHGRGGHLRGTVSV